jgi:hypothetical protein
MILRAVRVIGAVWRMPISAIVAMAWEPTRNSLPSAFFAARAAVRSRDSEEPWRERPPVARGEASPRPVQGSFTPRFLASAVLSPTRPEQAYLCCTRLA